ncbi:MAG: hypothetical protein Q8P99_01755 [bacterium]|nr:hypothetical protein [bacterium]
MVARTDCRFVREGDLAYYVALDGETTEVYIGNTVFSLKRGRRERAVPVHRIGRGISPGKYNSMLRRAQELMNEQAKQPGQLPLPMFN